jgi:hypothetical protein
VGVKDKFLIKYQGKDFVVYAGLLDTAHDMGLKSIITDLLQIPTDDNDKVAIVRASVEMDGGRVFTGIGDADPRNAGKVAGNALIRMAETRAKARALRDATNIGVTAWEEIGEEEPEATKPAKVSVTKDTVDAKVTELFPTNGAADPADDLRRKLEKLVRSKAPAGQEDAKWESAKNWAKQNRGVDVDSATVDSLQAIYDELKGKR